MSKKSNSNPEYLKIKHILYVLMYLVKKTRTQESV